MDRTRRELVQDALRGPLAGQFQKAVQWFYDPMTVRAFAGQMGEIATVYDCMDEYSKFSEAHPELTRREAELLARADVVFTGGRKLFEAKRQHHNRGARRNRSEDRAEMRGRRGLGVETA